MKNIKQINIGWIVVLALSFFPVFLWILAPATLPRFSNVKISMSNIGQILGLVGGAMFAINLVLSARLHFIEKLFFGLNRVYLRHSHLGQIAFMFLLFHPLMLIPKYAGDSFREAALFLLPSGSVALNYGSVSLIGMILLIVFTIFIPIKYNFWKISHKFFGFFFFLASLHIYFIPSDVSRFMPLRLYMLTLSFLGILAYVYYTILGKIFIKKFKYIVSSVNIMNDSVVEIVMQPKEKILKFKPGQFVFISFDDKKISRESHPFSITSNVSDKELRIAIKKFGDYTEKIKNLSIGSVAEIEGPYGVFSNTITENKKQIWIAGGIGITPFVSMAFSLKEGENYNVTLYYCLKNKNEAVYLEELQKLSSFNNNFKVIPFYSDIEGHINADWIENKSGSLKDKAIFLCASPLMIKDLKSQFSIKGISKYQIFSEEFSF